MLGKVSVCEGVCVCVYWFLDRQVVPLCPGGLQESREGGACQYTPWVAQTHTHKHFHRHRHTQGFCGRDKDNDMRNTCDVLPFGIRPECVRTAHKHALYWLKHFPYQATRYQPFSHFRRTRSHSHTETAPLGSWLPLLESHLRGADTLARGLIKHGV